ncbi:hypothetical protein PSTT_12004 [Puccinia striiformis]|uniref:Uncharacterized protein n=1 Tax=Puccinia striiformis TaxID=27350 RepID=A0A2S4UYB6_9BASI|nr:hypothetical protein PSTT_12004 [Puccinia striiformis]
MLPITSWSDNSADRPWRLILSLAAGGSNRQLPKGQRTSELRYEPSKKTGFQGSEGGKYVCVLLCKGRDFS